MGARVQQSFARADSHGYREPPGRRVDFLEAGKKQFLGNPEFGDLEIQNFGIQKMKKQKDSQNSNPFCPKCRQALDS